MMGHEQLLRILDALGLECSTDNTDQIVIYTGIYLRADGTLHDEPEPELQQQPEPRGWLKDQIG